MPRLSKYAETLTVLRETIGADLTTQKFSHLVGQHPGNVSRYLNGQVVPKKGVISSMLKHYASQMVFLPLVEREPIPDNRGNIPVGGGIYCLYGSAFNLLYVGKATNFRLEIKQTLGRRLTRMPRGKKMTTMHNLKYLATHYSLYSVSSGHLRKRIEAFLLRVTNGSTYNTNVGHFD
jgi:hypothetical protein